ncbi:alpha-D-ribose 1-methylphosphonate 5-triphosphate diphosphatase [Acidocella sp.]|jgi:alpha-D-ribose 1-methylphosphonate 5-triphosphate diphosphatase|uniref:alpha-D-ribose 1-methylphosphonate 5-triphosphate diphosphatase n=1 Tax=Acidocella sp. TaxID=50710 RepID=UPI002F3FE1CE
MTSLSNAQIVLPGSVLQGSLTIENGRIVAIGDAPAGENMEGDFLIPGIIDLHTDNLERQVLPRSNARWPSRSAMLAHDAQCAAAGITTVFDALCLGDIGFEKARNETFQNGYSDLRELTNAGMLKTDHFLHLRCELPAPEMPELLEVAIDDELVRLVSVMDHSPGLGQYADIERYRKMREREGHSPSKVDDDVVKLQANHQTYHAPNRALVLEAVQRRGIPLASHDDRTDEEVARNHGEGIAISEFPVSLEAARAARRLNMSTIAGAPNIVRGGSHSGNVSVTDLIRAGVLDALASDYVPAAMLEAAFCAVAQGLLALPQAVALITSGPADIVKLADRGRIAAGLRADLVQVRLFNGTPVIRAVWHQGKRIA